MTARPTWSLSLTAWGHPSHPRTFSGYSRALAAALGQRGLLRRQYSFKSLRAADVFAGAAVCRIGARGPRIELNRAWMWSARGCRTLSARLWRDIRRRGDEGPFLQIGTSVTLPEGLDHYVLTDMTIPQAHRAGRFAVAALSPRQVDEAVEVQRRVLSSARHVFTLTEWARDSVLSDYGLAPRDVTAVYIGPTRERPAAPPPAARRRQILFVGIDWDRKGGPYLVEAFRRLRGRLPDAELVIAGCSPKVSCPGVRVEGFLDPARADHRERLTRLYRESSCFALLSDFEPLGNVIVEAYDAGLPVVAYASGSRSEIVRHGESGMLCGDRSPETVSDALHAVLSDGPTTARMSAAASRLAATRFSWSSVIDRLDRVIGGRGAADPRPAAPPGPCPARPVNPPGSPTPPGSPNPPAPNPSDPTPPEPQP